jgi:UDP-N-acetylmuramoylalanine--D-glutamate ligase
MSENYYIFGLGKSGIASAKFLLSQGENVTTWDDNSVARLNLLHICEKAGIDAKLTFEDYNTANFSNYKALILAPGVPLLQNPHEVVKRARAAKIDIICDIEVLYQYAHKLAKNVKFVGITGTNGKSTTTALTHFVLKECGVDAEIGGNFGIPALELPITDDKVYVIEASSFQLDLLKETRFNAAVLLNVTPDHIDRYGSFEAYADSKRQVFMRQQNDDSAIIAIDDETTKEIAEEISSLSRAKIKPYSAKDRLVDADFDNLPGEHNRQNINAAYLVAKHFGIDDASIIAAIKKFPPLKHRAQFIREVDGVKFVNDSKATNANSTSHALKAFENIYWLAGGIAKEGGIEELSPLFTRVKKTYLYGKCKNEFAETLKKNSQNFEIFETLEEATKAAFNDAKNAGKGVVLLSPATASFDQFTSFEHRGDAFIDIVNKF